MIVIDDFQKEFQQLCDDEQPVMLELSKHAASLLFASLQLALRHPMNNGPTAEVVRGIAQQIQQAIATTPTLWAVAEMGWNPQYDVEQQ